MNPRYLRAALLALSFTAPACHAGVYKWTDDQGKIHYSDTPPAQRPSQEIRTDKANAAESEAARKALANKLTESDLKRKKAMEEEEKRKAEEEKQREQAEHCQRARAQLTLLSGAGRITRIDAQGQRYIMDDAQRQDSMAEAQKWVDQFCK